MAGAVGQSAHHDRPRPCAGASDYLWEDFIRLNADSLLPVIRPYVQGQAFYPPSASLPRRLEEALSGAANLVEQQDRLNQFKDRELFLIDLDHILSSENPDASFGLLSERLVLLAENLVAKAVQLVYANLVKEYGRPLDEDGIPHPMPRLDWGNWRRRSGICLGYRAAVCVQRGRSDRSGQSDPLPSPSSSNNWPSKPRSSCAPSAKASSAWTCACALWRRRSTCVQQPAIPRILLHGWACSSI